MQLTALLRRTKDVAHLVRGRLMPTQGACGAADYRALCTSLNALSSARGVLQGDDAQERLPAALQRIRACFGEPVVECMRFRT